MLVVGVVMERVIIRHFYDRPHEDQLLVTFGLGICFVEIVRFFFSSQSKTVPPPPLFSGHHLARLHVLSDLPPRRRRHRRGRAAGALFLVLYRTRLGMIVRAGIEDSVMVDSLGINVYRVFMVVFGIGAMAAGFRRHRQRAGRLAHARASATTILVQTFVVVVIGGVGSFPGRGARRPDRRRDHQPHLDGQSRLRLRHAVRGDDAGAGGAAARPARRRRAANERGRLMLKQRPFLIETLTAIGLIAAPFVLPYLGFAPNTVNRILVWGLFGIGFDILFGYTGLLSFGQSAFYGTGGFVAAYLLTRAGLPARAARR